MLQDLFLFFFVRVVDTKIGFRFLSTIFDYHPVMPDGLGHSFFKDILTLKIDAILVPLILTTSLGYPALPGMIQMRF